MPKSTKDAALPADQQWAQWLASDGKVPLSTWVERFSEVDNSKEAANQWTQLRDKIPFEHRKKIAEKALVLLRDWRNGSSAKKAKGEAFDYHKSNEENSVARKAAAADITRRGRMAREAVLRLVQWGWMDNGDDKTIKGTIEWHFQQWHANGDPKDAMQYCVALDERKLFAMWRQRNPGFGDLYKKAPLNSAGQLPDSLRSATAVMMQKGWVEESLEAIPLLFDAQAQAVVDQKTKAETFVRTANSLWGSLCNKTHTGDYAHVPQIAAQWQQMGLVPQSENGRATLLSELIKSKPFVEQEELLKVLKPCGFSAFDRDAENKDLLLSLLVSMAMEAQWGGADMCSLLVDAGADCNQETREGLSVLVLAKQLFAQNPIESRRVLLSKIEPRVIAAQEVKELRSLLDNGQKERDAELGEQLRVVMKAGLLRSSDGEPLSLEAFATLVQQALALQALQIQQDHPQKSQQAPDAASTSEGDQPATSVPHSGRRSRARL